MKRGWMAAIGMAVLTVGGHGKRKGVGVKTQGVTRMITATVLALGLVAAWALRATAADDLTLPNLAPPGGNVPGVTAGPMGPANSVQATLRYVLESAAKGKIGVYTAGVAGNPPHTGVEIPVFVNKGKGEVKTRFSVKCDQNSPAATSIVKLRYVLFQVDAGGAIVKTLVEKFQPVQYRFVCRRPTHPPQSPPVSDKKLPDITSRKGITIGGAVGGAGGKFSPWGGTIILTQADSFLQANGKCAFNISYDMVNLGPVATSPAFGNYLRTNIEVVSQQTGLSLNAAETKQVNTQAYLAPGTPFLALVLDKDHVVAESNEANNAFQVKIVLQAKCTK
jgi:hypothetical protein